MQKQILDKFISKFHNKFTNQSRNSLEDCFHFNFTPLKANEFFREELPDILTQYGNQRAEQERKRILEKIEKQRYKKERDCDCEGKCSFKNRTNGWNACIDKIKDIIREKFIQKP